MRLTALKPAAPVGIHLLLAALTWCTVGGVLLVLGSTWTLRWDSAWAIPALALAITLGLLKAWLVMRRIAQRTVARILERGGGRCVFSFIGWPSWLLVLVMIALGRWLRSSALPLPLVGLLYAWVGTALAAGSLVAWGALLRRRRLPPSPAV